MTALDSVNPTRPAVNATPVPDAFAGLAAPRGVAIGAARALAWRELVRFFRQRNRVIGAVATPLVFWAMLGLGLDRTVVIPPADATAIDTTTAAPAMGYLAYFFPGVVVLMVMFTAIFATISVIEDRREGFLQGVLVGPAPRWALVAGKIIGGSVIALLQAVAMLAIGVALLGFPGVTALVGALLALVFIAVMLNGLGLALAWPMDSTAGFHAVMNLLLMPMWLLSGAVFPAVSAGAPVKWLMFANPLTYGQWLVGRAWHGDASPALFDGVSSGTSVPTAGAVLAGCTLGAVALAAWSAGRKSEATR